jgi:hypothetical protein
MVGVLTRVRNNQVYNNDIDAGTKLVPYSITGGLWANNLTYNSNLTVGNLTVNGLTTTLDSTNLVISDPLFVINRNASGTNTYDLGIVLGRGNQTNVAMIWQETNKQFQLQYTTETTAGLTLGTINNSGYANLQAYGISVNNATIGTSTVTNFVSGNVSITGGTLNNVTIGATTPNTGVFTSVTTSSGGQLTGYHTGAIGANGGNTGAFTTITASTIGNSGANLTGATLVTTGNIYGGGNILAASGTGSTNTTTGALVVIGGIGASGDAYIGGNVYITGNLQAANISSIGYNQLIANVPLLYLSPTGISTYNYEIGFYSHKTDAIQGYNHTGLVRNHSDNAWYLFSNVRTEPTTQVDLANAYIIYDTLKLGNIIALSGNSSTSTTTGALVVTGGAGLSGVLNVGGNIYTASTTTSTSTTTGSIVAAGGIGLAGNINIGANSYVASTVNVPTVYTSNIYPYSNSGNINIYTVNNANLTINPNALTSNLIVHGLGTSSYYNLLTTNAANNAVGIRTVPSSLIANAGLYVSGTDSIVIPAGTTAQRPSGIGGMIRYNSSTDQLEFFKVGTQTWTGTGSTFTTVTADSFTGTGSQTNFTLSQSTTTAGVIVAVNGVLQIPVTAYSVSGTTLTFTEAPLNTDVIDARSIVTTSTVTSLSQLTSAVNLTDTGAGTGNANIIINNTLNYVSNNASNFFNNGISTLKSNVSCTAFVPTIIDSFSTTAFRGAKYVVSLQDYTNYNFQLSEVIMVLGNSNATVQTYGVVAANGTSFCNFYANVSGTTAQLYANSSTTSVVKVQQIYMPI